MNKLKDYLKNKRNLTKKITELDEAIDLLKTRINECERFLVTIESDNYNEVRV